MKNHPLISIFQSLIFIYIFYIATRGIVRIFTKSKPEEAINLIAAIIFIVIFIATFFYVISIYHIVGPFRTEKYYKALVYGMFAFLILGMILDNMFLFFKKINKN